MSDKPEPVNPNLKGFDSLPFDRAGEVVTGILLESISPQEALRILKAIPDRKGEGVDLVLDQLPSGTVKVRLEQGKDLAEVPEGINTPAVPWRRKDFGALVFNPDRIVTRQVPNVLPDLQLDGSAKK